MIDTSNLSSSLASLKEAAVVLQHERSLAPRVDGMIIGTGVADFTKDNPCYQLRYQGKPFQLMDVPGIEGNEPLVAGKIKEAIAKAHLILFVNGASKKPEARSVQKIQDYLRRGTLICPLINMRGSADHYEFEEDRRALTVAGAADNPLEATEAVLKAALGNDTVLPGQCVQGLVAFASLAIDVQTGQTTIHPSRDHDLAVHQRNYLKYFKNPASMRRFSQIDNITHILQTRVDGFREEIIESNKTKLRQLLSSTLHDLGHMKVANDAFMQKLEPEFVRVRTAIQQNIKDFEGGLSRSRRTTVDKIFNRMIEGTDEIIKEHFGEDDLVNSKCEKLFGALQHEWAVVDQKQLDDAIKHLQDSLQRDVGRLLENLQRLDFQHRIEFGAAGMQATYQTMKLEMGIGWAGVKQLLLKTFGGVLMGISYGPIGAALGAIAKLLMGFAELFMSKEKRVRKTQSKAQAQINEVRQKAIVSTANANAELFKAIRTEVDQTAIAKTDELYAKLRRPQEVIQQQMAAMEHVLKYMENMPHGTIQPIQN
jgi:hypothetical protein